MIRFVCPHCRKKLKAPPDKGGARTTCPDCKQVVRVPHASPTIPFKCALCGAVLERPEETTGEIMPCPTCKNLIAVPQPSPTGDVQTSEVVERGAVIGEVIEPMPPPRLPVPVRSRQVPAPPPPFPISAPVPIAQETKACAFCGEMVKAVAKKCKHCGETIDVALRVAEEAQRAVAHGVANVVNVNTVVTGADHGSSIASGLGTGSLVVGILSFLFCWMPGIGLLLGLLSLALGFPGIVFALKKGGGGGLGTSIAGVAVGMISVIIGFAMLSAISESSSKSGAPTPAYSR